jgi:hypothetical protein
MDYDCHDWWSMWHETHDLDVRLSTYTGTLLVATDLGKRNTPGLSRMSIDFILQKLWDTVRYQVRGTHYTRSMECGSWQWPANIFSPRTGSLVPRYLESVQKARIKAGWVRRDTHYANVLSCSSTECGSPIHCHVSSSEHWAPFRVGKQSNYVLSY